MHLEALRLPLRLLAAALLLLAAACSRTPDPVRPVPVRFNSNGPMLAGDLYAPRRPNGTGIVVLHGSSTRGRQLHLYPALCQALAARGYTLFNVDLRGYGESDDPPDPARPEDYDFVGDAIRAVRFAQAWESAQGIRNWILLGHSMGGGVAAHAGLQSAAIQGVVCISPGRRIEARFFAEASDQLKNLQRRKTRDMELPTPIPVDLLEPILGSYDVGRLSGTAWPKPFLLIEGAREPANDLEFSQAWFASLSGPVAHRVLPRADHYFGTAKVEVDGRKRWETTQPDVFDELVEIVDDWIQSNVGHR